MKSRCAQAVRERGVALVSSLLLLLIITIIALSMFRSFGSQEKIAGNLREKDRPAVRRMVADSARRFHRRQRAGGLRPGCTP